MDWSDIIKTLENLVHIKNTLVKISVDLNKHNINWGLGGSLLLYLNDIETTVNDIDIVIDESDLNKVAKLVSNYHHIEKPKNDIYLTEKFYSVTIDEVDIDLMVGFKVSTGNEIYSYPSGPNLFDKTISIDNININLCRLEDWQKAYTAMKRDNKIKLLKHMK